MSTQPPFSDPSRPIPAGYDTRLADPRGRTTVAHATPPQNAQSSIGVDDVYYTLFRHKWKIILCTLTGLIIASVLYFIIKPPFYSNAKLFVRYVVMEGRVGRPVADDTITKSPDRGGETIMQSEQEILTSADLARKVAEAIGPEKIAEKATLNEAVIHLRKNLIVESPKFSSILSITFKHSDPEIAQSVLREMIAQYLKMHVEIHRSAGMVGDFLAQETDQLRSRLSQTEDDLRKARAKAGVISIEESKRSYTTQIDTLRQQIFAARAEQAQRGAMLKELSAKLAKAAKPAPVTAAGTTSAAEEAELPPAVVDDFRNVSNRLESLRRREQELLLTFTAENSRVRDVRSQLADAERRKREMEEQHPRLTRTPVAIPAAGPTSPPDGFAERTASLEMEAAQLNALEAKVKVLTEQMEVLRKEVTSLDQVEGNIQELLRKKELEESNYRRYAASLEQSRINDALGSGKVSNISVIQTPSPPYIEPTKTLKLAGGIAAGGLALGLTWAFLIEMFLDRSVRRPTDIERTVRAPLFLTIPKQRAPRRRRFWQKKSKDAPAHGQPADDALLVLPGAAANNSVSAELIPYFETLRDRLIGYFESRNLTHKPKLLAVTGLGPDAGVTTIAANLARCLSETGDGNVLLVDLTPGQGSAQYFHHGKVDCSLEQLLASPDASAQVQERLYVVSDGSRGDKLSRLLPQRFSKLMPQLKSGEFDYIIFDMPPVSQISITPRLAGFMDMVLLVVESEKNNRDNVQRASALLAESNAHIGTILNKSTTYVPSWLQQELHA